MTTRRKKKAVPYESPRNFDGHTVMEVNGLKCQFNMPEAVKSKVIKNEAGEEIEMARGLPPYRQRQSFVVDKYPSCPDNWMNGSAKASSYFVPIKPEHGMWLDFNGNNNHTHDVAVVISVQGVNPLTGQKQNKLCLEKYKTNCPVHDVEFAQDRFCPKCKFAWPAQNYLASTGTPHGQLWLDGFRAPDGKVRQYVFTENESRGVAKAIIGNDRVFAIGIAFYLSKEAKPQPRYAMRTRGFAASGGLESLQTCDYMDEDCALESFGAANSVKTLSASPAGGQSATRGATRGAPRRAKAVKAKTYEVAAGGQIEQDVHPDPKELNHWEEEPAGMLYISYCDEKTANEILDAGVREETSEGFLAGIPVGHEVEEGGLE